MIKRKLTISQIILIVINLLPVLGVWFQGWDAARIFLFYCLETILIGIFHVIKMIIVMLLSASKEYKAFKTTYALFFAGLFIVCFFIMHYGIFVFVQTSMFFGISGIYKGDLLNLDLSTAKNLLGKEGMLMVAIFIVYYILDTVKQLTVFRIEKPSDLGKLMFQPYGRIFIQQLVLIFGSVFLAFGLGHVFIIVFVLTRLYIELFVNFDKNIHSALEANKLKIDNQRF